MWLLPLFSGLSSAALRVFYRLRVSGPPVPGSGPVLLVANHPNSLLDPAAVAGAARRPVRFLAKAPLFSDRQVGWLIRAAGAIPVYRRTDDPSLVELNEQTFQAAHAALAGGDAVGIFPEGLSHSEPTLAPLKTGAARIALGAAPLVGFAFPIVPVGLSFREKERFRSEALAVIGAPIDWDDIWREGTTGEAVRELTDRTARALRGVTLSLERWDDAPLVEAAEEIYAAELAPEADPGRRLARRAEAGEVLNRVRSSRREEWLSLADEVGRHDRVLRRLRLRPEQLGHPPPAAVALWGLRQLTTLAVLVIPAVIGAAAYYLPYRATGAIAARANPAQDIRASYKLLSGLALHLVWTVLLGVLAWALGGFRFALATLLLLPVTGLCALVLYERINRAGGEARRFLLRARRGPLLKEIRNRQRDLAARIEVLRTEIADPSAGPR